MVFFGFLHCVVVKYSDTLNRRAAPMFRVTELVWMVDAVMRRKNVCHIWLKGIVNNSNGRREEGIGLTWAKETWDFNDSSFPSSTSVKYEEHGWWLLFSLPLLLSHTGHGQHLDGWQFSSSSSSSSFLWCSNQYSVKERWQKTISSNVTNIL